MSSTNGETENQEDQTRSDIEEEVEESVGVSANDLPQGDQLQILKQRARMMGITFSNNIGIEALRERIRARMDGETQAQNQAPPPPPVQIEAQPQGQSQKPQSPVQRGKMTLRKMLQDEQLRLVRVRITNLDPKKKDLPGEIMTVANEYLGTIRKFVPFGEVTEEGFHVPFILYTLMEQRQFLNIRTVKDRRGVERVESGWAKEFSLDVLAPLTKGELERLAIAQAAEGFLSD